MAIRVAVFCLDRRYVPCDYARSVFPTAQIGARRRGRLHVPHHLRQETLRDGERSRPRRVGRSGIAVRLPDPEIE